jgi:hypothetical protein
MSLINNIYCDESCHLENDHQEIMTMGALWCEKEKTSTVFKRIREIKQKHKLSENFEIKWSKVSPSKIEFYLDIVDYFFDDDDLHFRCLVVPNKKALNHTKFNQTHNDFYYKMYFDLLKTILNPEDKYRIYIDIKDTKGGDKVRRLHEVLCNSIYDFERGIVENMQIVKSDEVELMQINDFLLGSVSYVNRDLKTSEAKGKLIERIRERSGYSLTKSTLYRENKFNIFIWKSK